MTLYLTVRFIIAFITCVLLVYYSSSVTSPKYHISFSCYLQDVQGQLDKEDRTVSLPPNTTININPCLASFILNKRNLAICAQHQTKCCTTKDAHWVLIVFISVASVRRMQ